MFGVSEKLDRALQDKWEAEEKLAAVRNVLAAVRSMLDAAESDNPTVPLPELVRDLVRERDEANEQADKIAESAGYLRRRLFDLLGGMMNDDELVRRVGEATTRHCARDVTNTLDRIREILKESE